MQNNEWRTCNAAPAFGINSLGQVRNNRTGRLLIPSNNGNGYLYVTAITAGKSKHYYVHRLVAEAFIDNPQGKKEVNHIDGNKANNIVSNLEWCTRSENMNHAINTGLKKVTEKQRKVARENGLAHIDELRRGWREWANTETARLHFLANLSRANNNRPVELIDDNDVPLKCFDSLSDAAKFIGTDVSSVSKVCNGKLKKIKQCRLRYKKQEVKP